MAVYASAFGAVGNGTTNDRTSIQNALNSVATSGGTVILDDNKQFRVSGGNLTVPRGVTLKGSVSQVGKRGNNAGSNYNTQAGIVLDPAYSIILRGGATLDGVLVRPYGMTFPQPNDLGYTGTAIRIDPGEDDAAVLNSMAIGFAMGIYALNSQRGRIERFNTDCVNGVHVKTSWDIWYLREVHCWPFGTISTVSHGDVKRRGIGIMFEDGGDWNKITDCFTYGYARGVYIKNCNSMTLTGVGTDNVVDNTRDAIGILIEGSCHDTKLIGCQAAASQRGVVLAVSVGNTIITELSTWVNGVGLQVTTNRPVILANSVIRDWAWAKVDNPGGATIHQSLVL